MNSAIYAEIGSHRSPFNGSGRHKGDRSADPVNLTFGGHKNWHPRTHDIVCKTFSHSLGQKEKYSLYWSLIDG